MVNRIGELGYWSYMTCLVNSSVMECPSGSYIFDYCGVVVYSITGHSGNKLDGSL